MTPEPWLRGPVEGVAPQLQPAAHALQNALHDVERVLAGDPTDEELRTRPFGAASLGYHLNHLCGAMDRLLTYAAAQPLTPAQREELTRESDRAEQDRLTIEAVATRVRSSIGRAIDVLRATDATTLTDPRGVGRAQLPSTVAGLLYHVAEHSARHAGQAVTTFRIVRGMRAAGVNAGEEEAGRAPARGAS